MTSPGDRLGHYEIVELIGEGGMGQVYRARDTRLERDVAVKILPADTAADPERRARFEREAKAIAAKEKSQQQAAAKKAIVEARAVAAAEAKANALAKKSAEAQARAAEKKAAEEKLAAAADAETAAEEKLRAAEELLKSLEPESGALDSAGSVVIGDVEYNSDSSITVSFESAFAGTAYLT